MFKIKRRVVGIICFLLTSVLSFSAFEKAFIAIRLSITSAHWIPSSTTFIGTPLKFRNHSNTFQNSNYYMMICNYVRLE